MNFCRKLVRAFRWLVPGLMGFYVIVLLIVHLILQPKVTELPHLAFERMALSHHVHYFERVDRERLRMEIKDQAYETVVDDGGAGIMAAADEQSGFVDYGWYDSDDDQIFFQNLPGVLLVPFLLAIAYLIMLWFIVLGNLLSHEFVYVHNKWIWLVAIILLPVVAPLYYLYIAEKQQVKQGKVGF